jgi:hypothetical protein
LTTEDIQAQEPREKVELFPNYTFVCFRAFDTDPVTDQIKPFNFYSLIFKEGLLTVSFTSLASFNIKSLIFPFPRSFISKSPIIVIQYGIDQISSRHTCLLHLIG